jgi:anti-sigma regulatory factor (Ser/Thr protein kinase)
VSESAVKTRPTARELRLAARPSQLKRARDFAGAAAGEFGLDDRGRYQFVSAASEAVANAIEHGAPCSDGKIGMRVAERGDLLTFAVCDCGTFTASFAEPEELPERGRGLALIAMLVDEVDLRPSGETTVLQLSKRRG